MTYDEMMAKAKQLAASGDIPSAKRLAQLAQKSRETVAPPPAVAAPEKGIWQTLKENVVGDNDPTTLNTGEKIGTLLNMGGNSLTWGLVGDEAAAKADEMLGRGSYDERLTKYRGDQASVRESNPGMSLAADILPALLAPTGALGTAGNLGLRMAKSAGLTGALSGVAGFMNGEGGFDNRVDSGLQAGAWGAGIGAAVPVVGSAFQALMNSHAGKKAIAAAAKNAPSTDQLRATGNALYKEVDDAGVQIAPQAFDRARGSILDDLRANTGFDELPGPGSLTPNSARTNQIMGEASIRMGADPTAALPFKALDQMRRQAGAAAGNVANKTDQKAGMTIIEGLDDFMKTLGPNDVVAGDIAALNAAIPKARDVWSRMSKSQMVDDAIEAGGDYLSGASSGIRNQFKNILRNKKLAGRFSDAEKAAMRRVVNGSIPEQLLNLVSGGLGQMATTIGGGAMGGLPGFLAGAGLAAGSRKLAENVTRGKAETVRGLIANGGMPNLPQASTALRDLMERQLRLGTAAALQPR
jgi:hypothetical protein